MTADPTWTPSQFLQRLDAAMDRAGVDLARAKMIKQILIYGEPMNTGVAELEPMADVLDLRLALEFVQTWFHTQPSTSPMLNADLLRAMQAAGYPIEGGVSGQ